MQLKTKGIVLYETPYGETSKILNVLTEDFGKISIISKGCRNIKNKLRGVSNKMNYCEYTISYKENGISTMIEGNTINSFKNVFGDMKKSIYSFYLIDLINQVLNENNDKELFYFLANSLIKINDGLSPELISSFVEINLLKYLGVSLNLDSCVNCGNTSDLITIDLNNGGCLCKNCYHDGYLFKEKSLKLIILLSKIDLGKIKELSITDNEVFKEIDNFLHEYYSHYTGIYLNKKDNLMKI